MAQDAQKSYGSKLKKLHNEAQKFGSVGYLTNIENWQKDRAGIIRRIDALYDFARANGFESEELHESRMTIRRLVVGPLSDTAEKARQAERDAEIAKLDRQILDKKRARFGGGYLDELAIDEARRKYSR